MHMQLTHVPNPELPLETKFVCSKVGAQKNLTKKSGFEWQPPINGELGYWYTYDATIAQKLQFVATPEAKLAIQDGIALKNTIYKLSSADKLDFDFDVPVPKGIHPMTGLPFAYDDYQKVAIYFSYLLKHVIIGDEMGLGKTIDAIGLINYDQSIKSVLVITKKKLKSNWVKECKRWLTRKLSVGAGLLHCDIVVVNYDQLVRRNVMVQDKDPEGVPLFDKKGKPVMVPAVDEQGNEILFPNPLLDALIARDWDMAVLDECHKIKNRKAKRSKGVKEIFGWPTNKERIRYRLMLTGTPIPNRPIEMFMPISLIQPNSKLAKLWYYGKRYCTGNTESTQKYHGNSNLDELQTKLRQTCMIRRMKAQVEKQMPPKLHSILPLDAEGEIAALVQKQIDIQVKWQKEKAELKADMQKYKDIDTAQYNYAASKMKECQGIYFTQMAKIRKELAVQKMPYVIEHLTDMLESGVDKVLVGVHHHEVADGIAEAMSEWGVVTLDGRDQSDTYLEEVQEKFNTDPNCRVFVGGILAAGEGLNLQVAHHVVFAELDWVPSNIKQFEDRTHRKGQKNHVIVQHLVFDGSLDSLFIEKLLEKQAIEDAALNTHAIAAAKAEAGE